MLIGLKKKKRKIKMDKISEEGMKNYETAKYLYDRYQKEINIYEGIQDFDYAHLNGILRGRIKILEEVINKIFKMEYGYFKKNKEENKNEQ